MMADPHDRRPIPRKRKPLEPRRPLEPGFILCPIEPLYDSQDLTDGKKPAQVHHKPCHKPYLNGDDVPCHKYEECEYREAYIIQQYTERVRKDFEKFNLDHPRWDQEDLEGKVDGEEEDT